MQFTIACFIYPWKFLTRYAVQFQAIHAIILLLVSLDVAWTYKSCLALDVVTRVSVMYERILHACALFGRSPRLCSSHDAQHHTASSASGRWAHLSFTHPSQDSLVYIFSQVILQVLPRSKHRSCQSTQAALIFWSLAFTRLLSQSSSVARQLYWFRLSGMDSFMWLLLEGTASSLVRRTMRETCYLPLPVGLRADERRQRRWRH